MDLFKNTGHALAIFAASYFVVIFSRGLVQGFIRNRHKPDVEISDEPQDIEVARRFWDGH